MGTDGTVADFTEDEIAKRRDDAIRRALSTPPTPLKKLVGKTDRAIARRESRVRKATRSKPKCP